MIVKAELKLWGIYFAALLGSIFLHELGHCAVAWANGFAAIPTPAKAYLPEPLPDSLTNYFSLGGVLGSFAFAFPALLFFVTSGTRYATALLAGGIAMPGLYTLRFMLQGRGHDGTEFQEAQAALGFTYSGHFVDYLFAGVFVTGIGLWVYKSRPSYKAASRIILGIVLTVAFVVILQYINNMIFDPVFVR